ncbi:MULTISPECIES: type II secretion system F family protein [unclassified Motilimonas]|uniref:type II secretion system F family protein n=1 Tax=Motilimonas TaxID=1914248 RepID=UPI001E36D20F|nr:MULTISPECIES: type II secretion system F family protein [unclassified Motilimonas]MCE0555807.1 type II secretion system F family protein [Motilimonas sp. E26]MDO6524144.1 type II secretion system F family protein [Motilimonas sp. 1_MG-2023]
MATFEYKGRDAQGSPITGRLEANDETTAADILLRRGVMPLTIKAAKAESDFDLSLWLERSIPMDQMVIFTRQMYSLTKAGIPIIRAINGLADSTHSKLLRRTLQDVSEQMRNGRPMSVAMQAHPKVFNSLFLSIVNVGENTGQLDKAFLQLSQYMELEQETQKRVKAAMRYPSFVLMALAAAMVILNIFVIPTFAGMFGKFGVELPWSTRVLMGTSAFFVNYWPYMLMAIIATYFAIKAWYNTTKGRLVWDRYKLRLPIVGDIINRTLLARYARSFSMMLTAGVPLNSALSYVAKATDNAYMEQQVLGMRAGIERGESLLRTSNASGLFTPLVLQMIAVGEETGQVDELLQEAAEFYEREVDYDLKSLTAKIEPILIAIVAGMVLILALGIFTPMWDMMRAFKGG